MAQRRAVTLLELLIAIGLVVALAAIVAPSLVGQVEQRRFDAAVDAVAQQLMLARAHAQTTGEPVEVRLVRDQRAAAPSANAAPASDDRAWRLEARLLKLELPDDVLTDAGGEAVAPGSVEDEGHATIYEPWALQQLPKGCVILDEQPPWLQKQPAARGGAFGEDMPALDRPAQHRPEDDAPIRIAVFLPDGSALLGRTRWLVDAEQRAATIDVNAWTGLPTVRPVEPADDAPAGDEQDDESPDDEPVEDEQDRFDDEPAGDGERGDGGSDADDGGAGGASGAGSTASRRRPPIEADDDDSEQDDSSR